MGILETLYAKLDQKQERMIEIRRFLHKHPELSFEEAETSAFIIDFYKNMDVVVRKNVGGYGVVVTIDSGKPGINIACRADFDALPITEETGLPFASENLGVMHACGHDGHTAYLLILAETLNEMKAEFTGKITLIHQPAEEKPPGGAIAMIEDGCLDGVDEVIGIHLMANEAVGIIDWRKGPCMTGGAIIEIKVQGKGGHGAMPQTAIDSILVGSEIVTTLQSIVSRRIGPFQSAALSIGSFDGVGASNVISDSIILRGTLRFIDNDVRDIALVEIERIVKGICLAYGASYECNLEQGYPVTVNDEKLSEFIFESLSTADIPEVREIVYGAIKEPSEDFSHYGHYRPACYFFVGARPEDKPDFPHHHPKFEKKKKALLIAAKAIGTVVVDKLTENK